MGAGLSGLQAAYEALTLHKKIIILDQNAIYQGTTASTTAKITCQHGYIYRDLINSFGATKAKLYYNFNLLGLKRLEAIIEKEKIDCDFQKVNGYLFANNEFEEMNIESEAKAYQELGIEAEIVRIDNRISAYKALKVKGQANFNIAKYIKGLTDILLKQDVQFFEN
ncbi:MAG: FAD-binding oxidoreductase, partial [Bacilli bacterium]|nr:FAD-binding oxidoreductase [Bacilli bacterium]